MIRISQLKLNIRHTEADLRTKICRLLCIREDMLISYARKKQSLDARKKPQLFYVYTIDVLVKNEKDIKKRLKRQKSANILFQPEIKRYSLNASGFKPPAHRPVIIEIGRAHV